MVDAYLERLTDPDPAVREAAAAAWCTWEDVHVSLDPAHEPYPPFQDPRMPIAPRARTSSTRGRTHRSSVIRASSTQCRALRTSRSHDPRRLDVGSPLVTALAFAPALARKPAGRGGARRPRRRDDDR